jgi:hypothetical protein
MAYGARHLKRAIERHLVLPLTRLVSTGQIAAGDRVGVDLAPAGDGLIFTKAAPEAAEPEPLAQSQALAWECYADPIHRESRVVSN